MTTETPIKITPIKGVWVCIDKNGYPDISTIHFYRSSSRSKLLAGSSVKWKVAKVNGWKCIKVNVNFTPQIPD